MTATVVGAACPLTFLAAGLVLLVLIARDHRKTSMIHTRVHVYVEFANPFLVCGLCRKPVPRWHDNTKCGCDQEFWNMPCEHTAGITSVCPSWSPVDGCCCREVLGSVDHDPAQVMGA